MKVAELFAQVMLTALEGEPSITVPLDIPKLTYDCLLDFLAWQLKVPQTTIKVSYSSNLQLEGCAQADSTLAIGVSGGIDSTIATHYAKILYHINPLLINVRYGAPYEMAEDAAISRLGLRIQCATVSEILLNASKFQQGYIIPLRNTVIAAALAQHAPNCWIIANYRVSDAGETANSGVSDKSPQFFCRVSELLSLMYDSFVSVTSPFLHLSKADTIKWFLSVKSDALDILKKTITCYEPVDNQSCGRCYACWKKGVALEKLDLIGDYDEWWKEWGWIHNPLVGPDVGKYIEREANKGR